MATKETGTPSAPKSRPKAGAAAALKRDTEALVDIVATQGQQIAVMMEAILALQKPTSGLARPPKKSQPDFVRSAQYYPEEWLKMHRDGFLTVIVPKTVDHLGTESLYVGAQDQGIKVFREHPTCIPLRFVSRIDGAKNIGTKLVKREEFSPEAREQMTQIEDVPTMMTETVPVQSRKYKYRGAMQVRTPTPDELAWARKRFPGDAALADQYHAKLQAEGDKLGE